MDKLFKSGKTGPNEDYYQTLGCDYSSSKEQIMSEYKTRALVLHPDKHNDQESEELFKQLVKAKDILTDPQMRKSYDKWRSSGIAISFEEWCRLGTGAHNSMHWRNSVQRDLMIGNGEQPNSRVNAKPSPMVRNNDCNEMLRKFRNYEI